MSERHIAEIEAGNDFRDLMVPKADAANHHAPLWHGWVIMDAFLAGIDWARKTDNTDALREQIVKMQEALEQAKAALLKIRKYSIAGAEEGYGKPDKWADALFASHGDVHYAVQAIDAALPSTQDELDG